MAGRFLTLWATRELSPRVWSNSCPLGWWCYLTISSSTTPILIFSKELALCIKWPKYWNFSFNNSFSNEYLGLISFRIDLFDLLAVQGTLKSLLLHHSLKASILQYSAFFIVQLSHPYMTTGKTIALTIWTFVGKVISLFFNMVFRASLVEQMVKTSTCNVRDMGLIPGLGRFPRRREWLPTSVF